jgi:DNA-binding protein H-NS
MSEKLYSLLEQKEKLEAKIEAERKNERLKLREQILELLEPSGYSISDIFDVRPIRTRSPSNTTYQDPADPSNTWGGRGRTPAWLSRYINQGRKLDEFRVGGKSID